MPPTVGVAAEDPVFTTATFIGYLVAGPSGAALSTLGIFLPSFIVYPFRAPPARLDLHGRVSRRRQRRAIGLMRALAWQLGRSAMVDRLTAGLALVATVVLLRWRVDSVCLIAGDTAIGAIARGLGF